MIVTKAQVITIRANENSHIGTFSFGEDIFTCSLGKTGIISGKKEGDGGTPKGKWAVRYGFYRADRLDRPQSLLPLRPLPQNAGWCDDVLHPSYNHFVDLPFAASHEVMNREDHLYDICIVLDYNIAPAIPPKGSAIFFHLLKTDEAGQIKPTQGCVGLSLPDMLTVLAKLMAGDIFDIDVS